MVLRINRGIACFAWRRQRAGLLLRILNREKPDAYAILVPCAAQQTNLRDCALKTHRRAITNYTRVIPGPHRSCCIEIPGSQRRRVRARGVVHVVEVSYVLVDCGS